MLEPQGTGFFLLLIVAFAALLFWVAVSKQVVFRVFAACLAFLPAMAFGIAAVNKYYDYYPTWGAMFNDLRGGSGGLPQYEQGSVGGGKKIQQDLNRDTNATLDAEFGTTFSTMITGPKTHITRQVIVYLPPQYFQKAYQNYRFPAILLLHGSPGNPIAWIDVLDVEATYLSLLTTGQAKPAVLVMPDTDGGLTYSLQCLNNPGGIQDMTYVAKEVPEDIYRNVVPRVQPPGRAWGVAGYSEGGFCAANIALNEPGLFGYAGVLSGYFYPLTSQVPEGTKPGGKPVRENVFADYPALKLQNTPAEYILHISGGVDLPQFFLAAGLADKGDVQAAEQFRQLVSLRQLNVPLDLVPGGHTGKVWRAALTPMLTWMTPQLTAAADAADHAPAQKTHLPQHLPQRTKVGTSKPVARSTSPARKH